MQQWFDKKFQAFAAKIPAEDVDLLTRPDTSSWVLEDTIENLRHGLTGQTTDGRVFERPWGFDLADIRGHVEVWQGGRDAQVPPGVGRRIAARLPNATLHFHEDGGHLFTSGHMDEIFAAVRRSSEES
jgi:pimeloyl-ACP methyl ester carboxylesterase